MKYQVESIENALRSGAKSISHAVIMAGYPLNGYTQKLGRIAAENCKKQIIKGRPIRCQRANIADYTKACIIDAIRKETSDNFVSVKDVLLRLRLSLGGGNHRTVAEVVDELGIRRQKDNYSNRCRKQKNQPVVAEPVVAEPVVAEPVVMSSEKIADSSDGFAIWENYLNAKGDFEAAKARYDAARAMVFDLLGIQYGE